MPVWGATERTSDVERAVESLASELWAHPIDSAHHQYRAIRSNRTIRRKHRAVLTLSSLLLKLLASLMQQLPDKLPMLP